MIGVRMISGLGNQLFQYATARALSLRLKTDLFLDLSWASINGDRQYALNRFNIQPPPPEKFFRLISWKFCKEPSSHQFYPEVLELPDNVFLHGYWQFENYFSKYESQIRNELTFKSPVSDLTLIWMKKIRDDSMPVSLHVRRGDYVTGNRYIVPQEFYERCVGILKENFPEMTLYIFSDDLDWCRQHFNFEIPTYFVNCNDESRAYEDLVLMSLCKHHIIANSTFSWWGAWLDNRIGSLIFAPRKFFKVYDPIHDSRRLPNRWIVFDDV